MLPCSGTYKGLDYEAKEDRYAGEYVMTVSCPAGGPIAAEEHAGRIGATSRRSLTIAAMCMIDDYLNNMPHDAGGEGGGAEE